VVVYGRHVDGWAEGVLGDLFKVRIVDSYRSEVDRSVRIDANVIVA
jgi:hypothetical protein